MKNLHLLSTALIMFITTSAFCSSKGKSEKLFNGKDLSNWELFIGNQLSGWKGAPVTKSAEEIFRVDEIDGIPVIAISGDINASIATERSFKNYHLTVKFKYGTKRYVDFNSGILYHSHGDFGVGLKTWMSSHELQLKSGNIGGSYRMGNTYMRVPAVKTDSGWVYKKGGDLVETGKKGTTSYISEDKDYENEGEWNTVEIYSFGRTSVHIVNGEVNCINFDSGKYVDGEVVPLDEGRIQIQSEGADIYISSMELTPIKSIPKRLLK